MSLWLFCLEGGALHPAWGAFQLIESLPPAGTSLGIAGPWGSAAKLTGCLRAEEGEGPALRGITWSGLRKSCIGQNWYQQFVVGLIWQLSCSPCCSCLQWAMADRASTSQGRTSMPEIFPLYFSCVSQGREGRRSHFTLCAAGNDITRSSGTFWHPV